jgi:hypothetical protein
MGGFELVNVCSFGEREDTWLNIPTKIVIYPGKVEFQFVMED